MEGDIQIYCGQTNLVVPLSEKTTLGIGGKTTFVSIDNSATYCNKEYDNWPRNTVTEQSLHLQ